jgi:hypothetical protein
LWRTGLNFFFEQVKPIAYFFVYFFRTHFDISRRKINAKREKIGSSIGQRRVALFTVVGHPETIDSFGI